MKNILYFILAICLFQINLSANTPSTFSFGGGLAIPSNSLSDFRNGGTLDFTKNDSVVQKGFLTGEQISAGYSIYVKMKFNMSNSLFFYGQISWNKFPSFYNTLSEDSGPNPLKKVVDLKVQASIIPLSAGMNYYLYDGLFGFYGIADLSYNFLNYSFEIGNSESNIIIPPSITDTRLGFSIGLGTQFKFELFKVNLEGKLNNLNFIGKGSNEQTKELYQILIGFEF